MQTYGKPSPTSQLDDILSEYRSSGDKVSEIKRPTGKIKVKVKGNTFQSLRKLFSSKKKIEEPKCANEKNIKVSGSQIKKLEINCQGCLHISGFATAECRYRCAQLVGNRTYGSLILDDGYYKKEYGEEDIQNLKELYDISETLSVQFPKECGLCAEEHIKQVNNLKRSMMKEPIELLSDGVEVVENENIIVKGVEKEICEGCQTRIVKSLDRTIAKLKKSQIVKRGYNFSPLIRPFFSNSKILFGLPPKSKIETTYETNGAKVILSKGTEEMYSIFPSEYKANKQELELMKTAYSTIIKKAGMLDEKQFGSFCNNEIRTICSKKGYDFGDEDIERMGSDLVRCTMGLDVIELLLKDTNLQDVYINSPIDTTPLYVKHKDFDDCRTNIYLSEQTAKNIISKFRLRSGRAFSEVSPILDMEIPEFGVRVNITGPPISPDGLAFAFRRASEEPWTLLRFIENRMISPMAAGLLGLMVNEESTILMCGDRGSGKTSMLTALIGAMPVKYRILTMEDTFEIPVPALSKGGGFRIQRMRIKPSTAQNSFEISADDAMRSLLRMGDSAIVMGEVRGQEAKTLYEAMNVGGSGNCVLGTIHGKSPRSLLERVIFSLGVPPQSFKATDLVVIADRIRPGGGSKKLRRVSEIVEVKKNWKEPEADKVFATLMSFNRKKDCLEIGTILKNPKNSEVICKIAEKRGVDPTVILVDVRTRAEAYEYAVDKFKKTKDHKLLNLKTMVGLNQKYSQLVDESIEQFGKANYEFVSDGIRSWMDDRSKGKIKIEIKNELRNPVQTV